MRAGIIGAGVMGRVHADALGRIDGVTVAAFAARTPPAETAELARRLRADVLPSAQALIERPDVDTVVVPGLPQKSELYYRLAARDSWVMPPLGTKVVDPAAVDVVREWIARMPPRAATAPPTP